MQRVGVVGAGVAGAAAAYALGDAEVSVTVFEAGEAVGGRACTCGHEGCRYDPGASYLKAADERVVELVTETLDTHGLVRVEGPIWRFDSEGAVTESTSGDGGEKWTYRDGLATLAERLLEPSEATVECETPVRAIEHSEGTSGDGDAEDGSGWWLEVGAGGSGADGRVGRGPFDAVVCTPPAPVTGELVGRGEWAGSDAGSDLVSACESVEYRPLWSVALHYPFELDRPYYGLVNADGAHDVSWLALEGRKPGYVPDGEGLLLVQLSPAWTSTYADGSGDAAVDRATTAAVGLLEDERLAEPDWSADHRWAHALVNGRLDEDTRAAATAAGLHVAGDWVAGEARLHTALRSGLETGETIRESLPN